LLKLKDEGFVLLTTFLEDPEGHYDEDLLASVGLFLGKLLRKSPNFRVVLWYSRCEKKIEIKFIHGESIDVVQDSCTLTRHHRFIHSTIICPNDTW
jgi:hypothetical protein